MTNEINRHLITARFDSSVAMHSIDCKRANLDRNKNSYYLVQMYCVYRVQRKLTIHYPLTVD